MRDMYRKLGLLILSLALLGSGTVDAAGPSEAKRASYSKACNHYVNRAKFKPRGAGASFVVILADSCQPALKSLESARGAERAAAADYLSRLMVLRDTVIDMNMERAFGKTYTRWTRMKSQRDDQVGPTPQVSETGEFLIAHRMGLLQAYKAWLDTGPKLALGLDRAGAEDEARP